MGLSNNVGILLSNLQQNKIRPSSITSTPDNLGMNKMGQPKRHTGNLIDHSLISNLQNSFLKKGMA